MSCPSTLDLSVAISEGLTPPLEAHLASCLTCAAEWRATRETIALAREASSPPSRARVEQVRTALLAASRSADVLASPLATPRVRSRVRHIVLVSTALAVAAGVVLVMRTRSSILPTHHAHGSVRALPGASFTTTTTTPDEVVHLHDGTIDVSVSPLHTGERFRVVLADAEIEVHGTQFLATAHAGKLANLEVVHGIVEVRPHVGASRFLHAGDVWHPEPTKVAVVTPAPAPPVVEPPEQPTPPPAATRPKLRKPARPTIATSPPVEKPAQVKPDPIVALPQERAYDDGWAALRASKFSEAATAFNRVQLLDPEGPLAEDADYWYAVSLARAGRAAEANSAFRAFLDRHPRSRRAGEASTMLGWLLVAANQRTEAERRFRGATSDPNPAVRKSARAGLDAIRVGP
ncbi:MAG: tetratricopeptide repeat protein [Kofleriaceae bacterium]|nr:tetratricopeptide repeat protein [Kofleriaceae bacterium]